MPESGGMGVGKLARSPTKNIKVSELCEYIGDLLHPSNSKSSKYACFTEFF